jgi:UDP-N-acetyl-D-mannosaminuronic acid dehydrogenase
MKKTNAKTNAFNRVSVLGLGYVGLPMAAIMATRGIEVIGVDVTPSVVAKINEGGIHIVEPGLDIVVRGAVGAGKLRATATPEPADAFIIAVPTPFKDGYVPDVSYCEATARAIAPGAEGSRPGRPGIHIAGRHDREHLALDRRNASRSQIPA